MFEWTPGFAIDDGVDAPLFHEIDEGAHHEGGPDAEIDEGAHHEGAHDAFFDPDIGIDDGVEGADEIPLDEDNDDEDNLDDAKPASMKMLKKITQTRPTKSQRSSSKTPTKSRKAVLNSIMGSKLSLKNRTRTFR